MYIYIYIHIYIYYIRGWNVGWIHGLAAWSRTEPIDRAKEWCRDALIDFPSMSPPLHHSHNASVHL